MEQIDRRSFLRHTAATGAALVAARGPAFAEEAVPNSSGTEAPRLKAPVGACDCHHHIYDAKFPFSRPGARMVANAQVGDYRALQRRLGLTRNIVVTPAPYPATAADNLVTIDALAAFGPNARGVAIVSPGITDGELRSLADGGVRGVRFSLAGSGASPPISAQTVAEIDALSKRVNELGWHVQFNIDAKQIVAIQDLRDRLPATIVLAHMAHMPQPAGIDDPAYAIVRR